MIQSLLSAAIPIVPILGLWILVGLFVLAVVLAGTDYGLLARLIARKLGEVNPMQMALFTIALISAAMVALGLAWQREKLMHEVDLRRAEADFVHQRVKLRKAELLNLTYERHMQTCDTHVQNIIGPLHDSFHKITPTNFAGWRKQLEDDPSPQNMRIIMRQTFEEQVRIATALSAAVPSLTVGLSAMFDEERRLAAERARIQSIGNWRNNPAEPANRK